MNTMQLLTDTDFTLEERSTCGKLRIAYDIKLILEDESDYDRIRIVSEKNRMTRAELIAAGFDGNLYLALPSMPVRNTPRHPQLVYRKTDGTFSYVRLYDKYSQK